MFVFISIRIQHRNFHFVLLRDTMYQSNSNLAKVFVRDDDKVQYEKRMYFNQPNPENFAYPFRKNTVLKLKPITPLKEPPTNDLSFGKFGCAKTPKRNRIDPTPTSSQLQQQSTVKLTNQAVVHTSTSPLLPAPPYTKSTNDVGVTRTLIGMRDSRTNADSGMNLFTSQVYYSTIPKPASHEPELPASVSLAADISSATMKAPAYLNVIPHENEPESVIELGSYSHSDLSVSMVSMFELSTQDEEGSTSSHSSPPNVISESEELQEESFEFNEDRDRQTNLSDGNSNNSGTGTIEDDDVEQEGDEEETVEKLGEEFNREQGEEDDAEEVEEDGEDEEENEGEDEEEDDDADADEVQEGEDGEEVEEDEDGGGVGVNEEVEDCKIVQENLRSVRTIKPEVDSSQFFEQSRLGRHSDRTQNEDVVVVEEESTIPMNSLPVADQAKVHPFVTANAFASSSPVFKELFEQLHALTADSDLDIFAKWGFLGSKNVKDKLSKIAEAEWEALLEADIIKEFMGMAYVKSIEINREGLKNPEPLYRGAMNAAAEMRRKRNENTST